MTTTVGISCPACGRVWACMTGTAANISEMILCKVCIGLDWQARAACEACGGTGIAPESFHCDCDCGEEFEPEEGA